MALASTGLCIAGLALAVGGCAGLSEEDAPVQAIARGDRGPEVRRLHDYLRTYGYLPNPELRRYAGWEPVVSEEAADPEAFDDVIEKALVSFQRRYRLPADGTLNEPTRALMKAPRCQVPDRAGDGSSSFVPSGSVWGHRNLTYSFGSYTPDLSVGTVQSLVGGAFSSWASAAGSTAGLSFSHVGWGGDIDINFYAYDGTFSVLAYAYYPTNGDIVFDEHEVWVDGAPVGAWDIDLGTVAVHEIGHSMGLDHSADGSAVMAPYYYGPKRALASDDIAGIRWLYGTPDPIYSISEYCRGIHNINWQAMSGATYYELYSSVSPSFPSPTLRYSGSSTTATINVGANSTWYLKVRACNAYGCTDFSQAVTATYYNGVCQ